MPATETEAGSVSPRVALVLFGQGLVYVGLQATNVVQLARQHYIGAFVVGVLISWLWGWNVKGVAFRNGWGGFIYSLGAGIGTVCGMFLVHWFYGR
jgi:hypothetical protein